MKKILITGINSYIGTSFEKWCLHYTNTYFINSIDVRDDSWMNTSFLGYDVVFHVAGIAHIKETRKNSELYYQVNRDLAFTIAQKSKKDGVKQFIFLSSASIYGMKAGIINKDTQLKPKSHYGKSKLQAEKLLEQLSDESFKLVILRPPMVYGKGCKGNYARLEKFIRKLYFFPNIDNQRSMLHINNLCEFIRLMIDNDEEGIFFPQNKEYVSTKELVQIIAESYGKKIKFTKMFNFLIRVMKNKVDIFNKVFGDCAYEQCLSVYKQHYYVVDLKDSIKYPEN